MSHIFISYSRNDITFAGKIVQALAENDLDTWIDWKSIPKGEDWEQEIYRGIEEADAFLFLISPDSVASEMCNKEIAHAVKNGKRILPIVIRDFDYKNISPYISNLNWIFCRERQDDFNNAIEESRKALHVDYEWLKFHTELQVKAIRWERRKDASTLLRGRELREAELQLATINVQQDPQPTILQREYIVSSRRNEERQRRQITIGLTLGLVIMVILSTFAWQQRNVAISLQATASHNANIENYSRATAQAQAKTEVSQNQTVGQQTEVISLRATVTYLQGLVQTQSLPSKTIIPQTITNTPNAISTHTPPATQSALTPISTHHPNPFIRTLQEYQDTPWFGPIGGALAAILVSLLALLVSRSQLGSATVSRSWLIALASKALHRLPGLGTWAIFFGYRNRLLSEQKDIKRAGQRYFDLPIIGRYDGRIIRLAASDDNQSYISKILAAQMPVIIVGKGGAGKTTLLARFAYLALTNTLPAALRDYVPIFVTSSSYKKGLLDSITTTLRQRDQLAVDEKMVQAQLETRKYLVLFDGVSEVTIDKQEAIKEILEFARNADYKNCRFIISTRPSVKLPGDIPTFELEPLTIDLIENLLPEYLSKPEQFDFVRSQLASFGKKPIEPLLFTMMIDQSEDGNISRTKATLFESYFRYLLGAKDQDEAWEGWSFLLGMFAEWSMLNTGNRGLGLDREELIGSMRKWKEKDLTLLAKLDEIYGLKFESERAILNFLSSSVLNKEREYWYFSHDSFEDFFAACRLIYLVRQKRWPKLPSWHTSTDQEKSFLGVIEFLDEIIFEMGSHGAMLKERILKKEKSELWKAQIKERI